MNNLSSIEEWAFDELKSAGVFPKDFKIPRGSNFGNFVMAQGVRALKAWNKCFEDENDEELHWLPHFVELDLMGFCHGTKTFPGPVIVPKVGAKAPWVPRKSKKRDRKIDEDQKVEIVIEEGEALPREIKRMATIPIEEFEEAVTDFNKAAAEFDKVVASITAEFKKY